MDPGDVYEVVKPEELAYRLLSLSDADLDALVERSGLEK